MHTGIESSDYYGDAVPGEEPPGLGEDLCHDLIVSRCTVDGDEERDGNCTTIMGREAQYISFANDPSC